MSDTPIQSLVLEAIADARCPMCSVLDALVFDELCQLQRQAVVDPETHALVVARGGYCAEHFWYLEELTSPVTNAELLAPLIDRVVERATQCATRLDTDPTLLRQGAAVVAGALGLPADCLVCQHVASWEAQTLQTLLDALAVPEHWQVFERSNGLCLPHLSSLLVMCRNISLARALLRAAAAQAERLSTALRTLVRKHQTRDRRGGSEDWTPTAAIQKLVGARRRTRQGN